MEALAYHATTEYVDAPLRVEVGDREDREMLDSGAISTKPLTTFLAATYSLTSH